MTSDPLAKEIQQFEQQVRRDPNGRAFARLADAYRKDGQLERALEVLEGGLPDHDDYLSAHLVHARTLRSLDRRVEAIGAFERVAELDSANVIALRALAELAEEGGQSDQALTYLEALLQILPQDEELEQAAERLRRDAESGGSEAEPETEPASTQRVPDSPWLMPDADEALDEFATPSEVLDEDEPWLVVGDRQKDDVLTEFADAGDAEEPAEVESGDFVLELPDEDVEPEDFVFDLPAEDAEPEEPEEFALELPDAEGADGQDFLLSLDSLMSEPTAEGEELAPIEGSGGEDHEDWRSSLSLMEDELDGIVLPELEGLAETPGNSAANPLEGWLVGDSAAEEPDEAEDVPGDGDLLTRTMADLYASQGQLERAEEIYAELLKDLPEDEELQTALAEVRSKMRHVPAASEPEAPALAEPEVAVELLEPVSPTTPDASTEGERSGTSEFFQEWLRSLED